MNGWVLGLGLLVAGASLVGGWLWWTATPKAESNWAMDHQVAPTFHLEGDELRVQGVRSFQWLSRKTFEPHWEERRYDLSRIQTVWYAVTPFSRVWRGPAHTLVSFEFEGGQFLALSIEARREEGETFGFLKGMLRRFEILYVAGDEEDLIALRALHRGDDVHLFPTRAGPETARALLLAMAEEANRLRNEPTFYHTLTDNCTTRLLLHLNEVRREQPLPWSWRVLFPGHSDALALRAGLLAVEGSIEEARIRGFVNDRARAAAGRPEFSLEIRKGWDEEPTRP